MGVAKFLSTMSWTIASPYHRPEHRASLAHERATSVLNHTKIICVRSCIRHQSRNRRLCLTQSCRGFCPSLLTAVASCRCPLFRRVALYLQSPSTAHFYPWRPPAPARVYLSLSPRRFSDQHGFSTDPYSVGVRLVEHQHRWGFDVRLGGVSGGAACGGGGVADDPQAEDAER